jgi:DNA-binding transcriptional regulator YhcF (GntR family)
MYQQVVARVVAALKAARLRKGDRLPSINEACARSGLSRDTVVKAYAELERQRLLSPVHGKGFFVRSDGGDLRIRTFVLFDTLNAYKERLYAGLSDKLAGRAQLDVCFHHFNGGLFQRLLHDARGRYDRYVVMPFPDPDLADAIAALEPEKLLLLDIQAHAGEGRAWIGQSFDAALVGALEAGLERLHRYRRLVLVFPPGKHNPEEIQDAVRRFGARHRLPVEVVPSLPEEEVRPGTAYLVLEDDDLVSLIKYCRDTGHRLGADVGVISYNDTPLKEVVAGGITVVTTDFYALGVRAGEHVLAPAQVRETRPTRLVLRSSL